MIPCDEHYARDGPELDEHHPPGVAEGAGVMIGHTHPQGGASLLPGLVDQGGRDDVLDPGPSVAPSDSHQELQAVGGEGDGGGRDQGQEGEDRLPGPVGIPPALSEEQGLEVVAQGDGDDGEVCAEREDREEREEDVKREEKPGVGWRWLGRKLFHKPGSDYKNTLLTYLEVESVEIIEVSEGKYSCEGEEEIEGEDEPVVGENERVEPPLVTDGSDETRERVMTHEAVHTDSEQVG